MSYLAMAALLSALVFPCMAETFEEQFSRMDLNRDGFLSEQEFVQGMKQTQSDIVSAKEAASANGLSDAEKQKLVDEAVTDTKKILPYKVDASTTWTDVYGGKAEINYVYRIEMDVGPMPAEQADMLRPVLEAQICPKVKSGMCGVANDTLLKNGISIMTHYNDKTGKPLAECRFTQADCQ